MELFSFKEFDVDVLIFKRELLLEVGYFVYIIF